ncbi:MAG: Cof-type HAD-IIB family hydrolase [Bacteroidales bacterium]|jgi:Cof subfamily protein (haloacid dehalogenase superfamily)|nr:Cof-type HAD-IIB family hydrolase [Bacteroidales bacterium]
MIKAIFFDIDGTLVSFKSHTVPRSTVDAINEAKKNGIKIFIATGRSFPQIPDLGNLQFDGYITLNGAYCITDKDDIVVKNPIPEDDIKALLTYLENGQQFPCSFMTKDKISINYVNQRVEEMARLVNLPVPGIIDIHEAAKDEIFQINVYVDEDVERQLMKDIFIHCDSSRWNHLFADINVQGNSKQTGIDEFLKYYDLRIEETMAFGDGGNDMSMLKHVAIGVAMGNAKDQVKAVADYVTDSVDDDGVRNALVHYNII